MALRNRLDRLFGRDRPQPQRPGLPANQSRTVGAPGRVSSRSSDWERQAPAPEYVGPSGGPWSYVPNHRELTVQRVTQGADWWGVPHGSDLDDSEWVTVAGSTSNPSRPRCLSLSYSYDESILEVTYREGAVYQYFDVTPSQWSSIQHSWSPGRWINDNALNSHSYRRIR